MTTVTLFWIRKFYTQQITVFHNLDNVFFSIGIRKSALTSKALTMLSKKEVSVVYSPYPVLTHSSDNYVSLQSILGHLSEPEYSTDLSQRHYSKAKFMGKHCQGQTEINPNGIGPTIRAEHHGNIEFRRLSKANGGKNDKELKKGTARTKVDR